MSETNFRQILVASSASLIYQVQNEVFYVTKEIFKVFSLRVSIVNWENDWVNKVGDGASKMCLSWHPVWVNVAFQIHIFCCFFSLIELIKNVPRSHANEHFVIFLDCGSVLVYSLCIQNNGIGCAKMYEHRKRESERNNCICREEAVHLIHCFGL